jgi:peptidyl-prolyl cis-trans isomerase D
MLNVLRESFKKTPYLKWILILVGASLVLYLGNVFTGDAAGTGGNDWVARINGAEVSERSFREAARNLDQRYRELLGGSFDQLRDQLTIGQRALNSLITRELVLQDAKRMGLASSPADLAAQIRNHPELQDANGQFIGKERYENVLSRGYAGGVSAFEQSLAADLLFERWTRLVSQPVTVGDEELQQIFRRRTEKTAIDYVVVTSESQEIDREVSEEELRRWYDDHRDSYMRSEGREIRYVVIDREAHEARMQPSDSDIREYYEANASTYTHPEQRRARHILLRADPEAPATDETEQAWRATAAAVLERLRGGEDFATLARELSEDPLTAERGGDLGFFGPGEMFEGFETTAFATPVGQLADVTETPHGLHVLEVTDSREAGVTPLADVEDEIRRLLGLQQANERIAAEAARLHSAMGSGDRLAEIAENEGLAVESRTVTRNQPLPELGPAFEFLSIVATLEPGTLSSPLPVASGLALVTVDQILPPSPAPFEDVKLSVTSEFLDDRARRAALTVAEAALAKHGDPASVAQRFGLEVGSSGDLAPGQAPPEAGGVTPDLTAKLFGPEASAGDRGAIGVPAGALVYQISSREPFDAERFESERATLLDETLQSRRASYVEAIINRMLQQHEVEINPAWHETLNPSG